MKEEQKEYFNMLNRLYDYVVWCFSSYEKEILQDKIDEIINWSYYFLQRSDKE